MSEMNTSRDTNYSKESYIWTLSNKLGCNIELANNYLDKQGNKMFSKWISYLKLCEYEQDEYIPLAYCTRKEFIKKATHRSVLDIEILIDIDEKDNYNSIKEKTKAICKQLKGNNIEYVISFSGSKSYHISILLPELRDYSEHQQVEIKKTILKSFGGDLAKASLRNMIALEGEPHWKTGIIKKEVLLWVN